MASKKTLTAKNLEALGVKRLAELLIEITTDDPAAKRRLRLELAGREGPSAVGRHKDAQQARWVCFEGSLSPEHLRAYLQRLPDFDDIEAEERALDHVQNFENPIPALAFLVSWTTLDRPSVASRPALNRAAELIVRRAVEVDGNFYDVLNSVADALSGTHPLAATLALRSMIDFALARARSSRYGHAARHLMTCSTLATAINDFGAFETHDAYAARLRQEHGRKSSFWSHVDSLARPS